MKSVVPHALITSHNLLEIFFFASHETCDAAADLAMERGARWAKIILPDAVEFIDGHWMEFMAYFHTQVVPFLEARSKLPLADRPAFNYVDAIALLE